MTKFQVGDPVTQVRMYGGELLTPRRLRYIEEVRTSQPGNRVSYIIDGKPYEEGDLELTNPDEA